MNFALTGTLALHISTIHQDEIDPDFELTDDDLVEAMLSPGTNTIIDNATIERRDLTQDEAAALMNEYGGSDFQLTGSSIPVIEGMWFAIADQPHMDQYGDWTSTFISIQEEE